MAFTGTAVVHQLADNLARITGLSLAGGGVAGTIGLHGSAGSPDVRLPQSFKAGPYKNPEGVLVSLQDSVEVSYNFLASPTTAVPISVVKTGTTLEDFLITMTDSLALEGAATGALEIYVRFH